MTEDFLACRGLLFGIAYRMLGSVAEAEDAVQDVYLRWRERGDEEIRSARAWLLAATTRLCIDRLRTAQRRRQDYFGVWLPEPLLEAEAAGAPPGNLADSLATAFLVLLETLTPQERAVYILREAFDYTYREIAAIVGQSEANCRQIARRAKQHLGQGPVRRPGNSEHAEELVGQFVAAVRDANVDGLLAALAADATLRTDGGGRVRSAPWPIQGAGRVARFFCGIRPNIPADVECRFGRVNGDLGLLVFSGATPVAVLTFTFERGRIREIFSVSNPDKLRHLGRPN